MFTCTCGQPVRAIYYPDENQYMPADECQDCHEKELNEEWDRHIEEMDALYKEQLASQDDDDLPF